MRIPVSSLDFYFLTGVSLPEFGAHVVADTEGYMQSLTYFENTRPVYRNTYHQDTARYIFETIEYPMFTLDAPFDFKAVDANILAGLQDVTEQTFNALSIDEQDVLVEKQQHMAQALGWINVISKKVRHVYERNCSFCGKSDTEVAKLIAGPSTFICNECISLCGDILAAS